MGTERCRVRQETGRLVVAVGELDLVLPETDGVGCYVARVGEGEAQVVLPIDR